MTKHELIDWMGCQTSDRRFDTVRVAVECDSLKQAQLIADMITEIMGGCEKFNAHDYDDRYWKYLWLYQAYDKDRVLNAYSVSFPADRFPNAVLITGDEWLEAIHRYKNKVEVGDLI